MSCMNMSGKAVTATKMEISIKITGDKVVGMEILIGFH